MGLDKNSIARLIIFILAWVNSFLASKGYKTIPVLDQATVALIIAFVVSAYTFYKHNFLGKKGKELKDAIVKESEVLVKEAVDHLPKQSVVNSTVQPTEQKVEMTVVQPTTPVQQDNQPPVQKVEVTVAPQPTDNTK
jgi:SPP1 family holin